MKSGEMYTVAAQNPKARFKRLENGKVYTFSDAGVLTVNGDIDSNFTPRLNEDWELVREPVTWQEAIQAWLDGNAIELELNGNTYLFDHMNAAIQIHRDAFEYGKWYIK